MADEAGTTITELPDSPTQERLLHAFSDDFIGIAESKVEELLEKHGYLSIADRFDGLVTDLEQAAKDAGWDVEKPVIFAVASNVMVRTMLYADMDLVKAYPVVPELELVPRPAAADSDGGQAGGGQTNQAQQQGEAQTGQQQQEAATGAIPPAAALEGGAGAPKPPEGSESGPGGA